VHPITAKARRVTIELLGASMLERIKKQMKPGWSWHNGAVEFGGSAMTIKEQIAQQLDGLSEAELGQVAEYLAFLKFRSRVKSMPALDETKLAALYAEFADEDRELAEQGMSDYAESLAEEDAR
jgi:hypothetical protein